MCNKVTTQNLRAENLRGFINLRPPFATIFDTKSNFNLCYLFSDRMSLSELTGLKNKPNPLIIKSPNIVAKIEVSEIQNFFANIIFRDLGKHLKAEFRDLGTENRIQESWIFVQNQNFGYYDQNKRFKDCNPFWACPYLYNQHQLKCLQKPKSKSNVIN